MGYSVTIVGQTKEKCIHVSEQILSLTGNKVDWIAGDLSTLDGIRTIASVYTNRNESLQILINNAGAFFFRKIITKDGFEKTFALNHLNYFYLTLLLLDLLKGSQPARVINVSSMAHMSLTKLNFDNLNGEKHYSGWEAYSKSKLCNLLFTYELARILSNESISVNAVHPGYVGSGFAMNNGIFIKVFTSIGSRLFARTPEKGAETCIYLAISSNGKLTTGKYFMDCHETQSSKLSMDRSLASRLWQESMDMIV